ncbi:hypothetical protein H5T87_08945 [bacterium]|nr:hypothetical protein [bacterium]
MDAIKEIMSYSLLTFIAAGIILLSASTSNALDALLSNFLHPPQSAKPHTWWHWVNGSITAEGITKDLEEMKDKGVGGAQIFNVAPGNPPGPVLFMSPEWHELFKHAVKEVERLGLELCIHNCAGWSSSGGPWIPPEYAMKRVTWSEVQVEGPKRFEDTLPQPPTVAGFYRDIAVLAYPTPGSNWKIENWEGKACFHRMDTPAPDTRPVPAEAIIPRNKIIDLSSHISSEGRLVWDVPEGKWTIVRFGYTLTGAQNAPAPDSGRGWECDKLSREALELHWKHAIQPLLEEIGPLAGKVFKSVLIDSYEMGSQNWTDKMREEFLKRRGYDLLPFLPVITGRVVDNLDISERFLWDFRRTIADLFNENYYGYFGELCRKHGLLLWVEPYGNGPFDDITAGSKADIPMSEFWIGHGLGVEKDWNAKLASSIGHIYGKKIVGAESFTAGPPHSGWVNHPYSIKALGDLIFCSGVNRYVFHTFAHQPWLNYKPGMTMGPWGLQFNRCNTWWNDAKAWLTYIARCQYLLQQGQFVGDVLFYVGENSPVSIRTSQPLPPSYDFDACDTETLLQRLTVKGNKLVISSGMSYEVLVLPNEREMTPSVLKRIGELVKTGAYVIGPKPLRSPSLMDYPRADNEVQKLADEIWGNCDGQKITEHKYGRGKVFWGKSVEEVLKLKGVKPDFEFSGTVPGTAINYIHRRNGDTDIYFLANMRERYETVECTFRVKGKVPELWYPDSGKVERAPMFKMVDGRTQLTIAFEPYGSLFVIFRQPTRERKAVAKILHNGKDALLPQPNVSGKLEITRAIYGILEDPTKQVDVTEQLRKMVKNNMLYVIASNSIAGDPAPFVVKKMRVDYTWNGEPRTIIVNENELVEIPGGIVTTAPKVKLSVNPQGKLELLVFATGNYEIQMTTGRKINVSIPTLPKSLDINGPWEVHFPPNWGAPEKAIFDKLISWSEHPDEGIKFFSGTAKYVKEIEIPKDMLAKDRVVYLDLGDVQVTARVKLNGKELGILWKKPYQVDITYALKPGKNILEIEVTNLWPNRLIGDEHLPPDREWNPGDAGWGASLKEIPQWVWQGKPSPTGRYTFTTWRHHTANSPLLPSGLLGPVKLLVGVKKVVSL